MNKKIWLLSAALIFLFSSCQTINENRTKLGIPQSNVFFTFDDGPDIDTTPVLLEVLEQYQIRAIFCLLGINAEHYPELVREIYDHGHYIINHGYSGKFSINMKNDAFLNNITRGENAISSGTGHTTSQKLYRPHGGFYNSRQVKICSDEGYTIVPVTIRVYDAAVSSAKQEKIKNRVIKKVVHDNGGIILLHDSRDSYKSKIASLEKNPESCFNRSWIPYIVKEIIISLTDKGFVFPDPDICINPLLTP